MELIIQILIWAVIGWLASVVMKSSYAWWVNILLGIGGGWLGSFLLGGFFESLGSVAGISLGGIVTGVIGAVIIVAIVRLIKK